MKARTMQRLRRWHLYLGMFFAPAILLFAISGGLQTFRLHEAKGYGGTPPSWLVWMASVHRDDRLPQREVANTRVQADQHDPAGGQDHAAPTAVPKTNMSRLLVRIFAALLSIGLTLSALLGVVIALSNRASRKVSLAMLAAGTALPVVLLYL